MNDRNFRQMLEAQWAKGNFVCVGLDSEFGKIPTCVRFMKDGEAADEEFAVRKFNERIVDETKNLVCAYKLNVAFYEALGDVGYRALRETVAYIHEVAPDVPVILDAKRADIGNTNAGYVRFAFGFVGADAVTVHPYLGAEALQPFLARKEKGIIVLCRTSNPGADEFQDRKVVLTFGELAELVGNADEADNLIGTMGWSDPSGSYRMPMYQYVALRVSRHWNKNGNCALVVGATCPDELREVRGLVGNMPILIPGIGAQGGDVEKTVTAGKDSRGRGIIINSSRGIIFASDSSDFAEAARRETEKLRDLINRYR